MRRRLAGRSERGFAMLLVFAMAAASAMLLYMEAPRIVFEGQRNKEQLLIERGEQYKRAVQVYYRKNKKLPQRIEDLERGTETRFLRHRYKDPFTGKDDWKLIESDGVNLKNSLVKKPTDALGKKGGETATDASQPQQQQPVTFNAFGQPVQTPCVPGQPCEQNQALQRRASDRPAAPAGQGEQPAGLPACDPSFPIDPAKCDPSKQWDPKTIAQQQQQSQQQQQQPVGIPGQSPFPGQPYPGQPGAPGTSPYPQPGIPGIPGFPGGLPGAVPRPGGPINSQTGGAATSPIQPGLAPGGPQSNQALGMINQLLTTPRAGGLPGQTGATAMGPGIVGVATKHEGVGIKIYAERTKYQEWEFVYDPKEEKAPNMNGSQQQQQQPGNGNNPLGGPQPGSGSSLGGGIQPGGPGGMGPATGIGRQR